MKGVVSALLFGLITDRALIIKDPILEPLFNPDIAWVAKRIPTSEQDLRVSVSRTCSEDLGCKDQKAHYANAPVVTLSTDEYLAPLWMHNPHHRDALHQLVGPTPFHTLAAYLFAPKGDLHRHVQEAVATLHSLARYSIGLQVDLKSLIKPIDEESLFYKCGTLRANEMLPRLSTAGPPIFFLSTPSEEVAPRARAWLATQGHRVVTLEDLMPHPPKEANMRTAVELLVLAKCSELIVSYPRSSLGSLAAGLHGTPPTGVYTGLYKKNFCLKLLVPDPCFNGWHERWKLSCYRAAVHESPETINQSNCLFLREGQGLQADEVLPFPEDNAEATEGTPSVPQGYPFPKAEQFRNPAVADRLRALE